MKDVTFNSASRMRALEVPYVPPAPVLKFFALGHPSFVADILYIRASMYFGDHLFSDRRYEWLELYLESSIELDPRFLQLYKWGAIWMKLGEYVIRRENVEKSIRMAERGLDYFPNDYWFYEWVGFEYLFQMADLMEFKQKPPSNDEKEAWQKKGIEYYRIASELNPNAVDPIFVSQILSKTGRVKAAIMHSLSTYHNIENQKFRDDSRAQINRMMARLGHLERSDFAKQLEEVFQRHKTQMHYIPTALWFMIDDKISGSTDLDRLLRVTVQ